MPTDLPGAVPFAARHIGPRDHDLPAMLQAIGAASLDALIDATVPNDIRLRRPLQLPAACTEGELLQHLRAMGGKNRTLRSFIGMGYYGCATPPVLQRNILENPNWYTPYTPYQAEISQGRLEALLNFQTMVAELTALPVANASLLDEGTAAAEAMTLCLNAAKQPARAFFVSHGCHPQTIAVVQTRALPLGIEVIVGDHATFDFARTPVCGALVQYPSTEGTLHDYRDFAAQAHAHQALVVVATDLLALTLLTPPGEWGGDIAIGSSQRFGIPMGYGGPHAAFFATRDEFKRLVPGRLIGVSIDQQGNPALRLALQTREQHIRRAKATSNICTAQVLLAVMAGMYAAYHGPEGLQHIATRIRTLTSHFADRLTALGYSLTPGPYFDTLTVMTNSTTADTIMTRAVERGLNLRRTAPDRIGLSFDELTTRDDLETLLAVFAESTPTARAVSLGTTAAQAPALPAAFARRSTYLTHAVFHRYRSETEMMRYLSRLADRDLSLCQAMTPLGSCTMKLNAAAEMLPITWPEWNGLHPFAPTDQTQGYRQLTDELERMLAEITGLDAVSLQPNAGSQGEYAGLLAIRAYHRSRGETGRNICLIPISAHGTNPATATMAGLEVVGVDCDAAGNIDLADLRAKATQHRERLAAIMVTYPSTHGVFEEGIRELCEIVHGNGGQVYMDGANLNAQVGLSRPGDFGIDVCHLNLHKTFCIPHGGGGPGVGPIAVKSHLAPFLPTHPLVTMGGARGSAVSAAPWGSASILLISYAYLAMMGAEGATQATKIAILNANYIAKRLAAYFPVLFTGRHGYVAHECIVDARPLKASAGIEVEDIAKRLIDFGFHAPTMSWPIAGTLMIEPTESESKEELDRFCDAMIAIHAEAQAIAGGALPRDDNPLKNAPHTIAAIATANWSHPYSREQAVFPAPWVREHKFWPPVGRVNNPYGDRHFVCTCPSVADVAATSTAA